MIAHNDLRTLSAKNESFGTQPPCKTCRASKAGSGPFQGFTNVKTSRASIGQYALSECFW